MKLYSVDVCDGRRNRGTTFKVEANNISRAIRKATRMAAKDPWVKQNLPNWYVDQVMGRPHTQAGSRKILWDSFNGRLWAPRIA